MTVLTDGFNVNYHCVNEVSISVDVTIMFSVSKADPFAQHL